MKHWFLAVLLMVFAVPAFAGTVLSTDGLTIEQKAQLELEAAKMKKEAAQTVKIETAEEVSKWVNVGKEIGLGLNATAKELGVTANELAGTPVGMIAIGLIAWNYVGADIVGVLFGTFWLMFTIPIWVWMYRSRFVIASKRFYDKGAREDGLRKLVDYQRTNEDDAVHFIYWVTLMITCLIGVLTIFV